MRNPVQVVLEGWQPHILRFVDVMGLRPPLERTVRWLNGWLAR